MVDRAVNAELESVILEDPLDPAGWLVYGDWLAEQGDPRGELVAVQARLARDPGNPELMEAQRAFFRAHGDWLLDGLHPYLTPRTHADGEVLPSLLRLSWEFGFLWTASVSPRGRTMSEVVFGLRALLRHPSSRFLHALSIATPSGDGWAPVLEELLEDRRPRPLRILYLGDSAVTAQGNPRPAFGPIGDVAALWSVFPHLEVVALRGGHVSVGALDLPRLRELTIETSALQRETLIALGARPRPHLERLELWFGERRCTATLADLGPVLEAAHFPRLRHLGLRNCSFVDRICHALVHARIAKQLHVLDLSLGALTDMGAAALVDARHALANLAVLDLSWNYIDREWRAPLSELAGFVDLSNHTYLSDGEVTPRPRVWLDT
ncbi:MAG: TIGR02996 domain-containing protein [Labilithrix sp.]|nr:TIGR02996 domain-containing protein [Labilithrix sp.]MCW5816605.1 TIGR02996 domain-containing protein [Labilithrix sp.]